MTHFCFNHKKLSLSANPAVQMVAPAPEEDAGEEKATPKPSEDSDSGESYEAQQDDLSVSPGDVEVAIRVVHASEAFSGQCFRCNKVGHRFCDKECEMYNPQFLNSGQGPAKTSQGQQAPEVKDQPKLTQLNKSNQKEDKEVGGKEDVLAHEVHIPPFPKSHSNPSPTDLPARGNIMLCHLDC